jgi:hypothetical protein
LRVTSRGLGDVYKRQCLSSIARMYSSREPSDGLDLV